MSVITSTIEVPRTVVRPKHVQLDRCTRTSRSALVGRSERRRLSDRSVVSRSPMSAYTCFLTDVNGHFLSMLWRHRMRTFRATFNGPRTHDRGAVTAMHPVKFADRCSVVSLTSGFVRTSN